MKEVIRKHETKVPATSDFWDPPQWLRELVRWEPMREPAAILETLSRFVPDFDIKETKDTYVLKADLPGVHVEDLEVHIAGNRLKIAGRRAAEEKKEGEAFYALERTYGTFSRVFTLPEGADPERVQAELQDGILTLIVPKRPEEKTRQVTVKTGRTGEMLR